MISSRYFFLQSVLGGQIRTRTKTFNTVQSSDLLTSEKGFMCSSVHYQWDSPITQRWHKPSIFGASVSGRSHVGKCFCAISIQSKEYNDNRFVAYLRPTLSSESI